MESVIKTFTKNVAASGTPEPLQANRLASDFIRIRARASNTNPVFIGDATSQDYVLRAGDELPLNEILGKNGGSATIDMAKIWCKVTTNGEGVTVIYRVIPSAGL